MLRKYILPALFIISGHFVAGAQTVYESNRLQIQQILPGVYLHTSYLTIPDYGAFPCNGLVYINQKEAVIIDTPVDDTTTLELIGWIQKSDVILLEVIPTHFHVDCLGGLQAFHNHGVPSYAHQKTIDLAHGKNKVLPQNGFDGVDSLKVGNSLIVLYFPGPGHTDDNIVVYLPEEQVLFGGCLVKELNAGKGNLEDADVAQWSATINMVQKQFPEVKIVVPGHGSFGGPELLNYTYQLFKP